MKPMLKSLMAAVFVFALALVMAAPAQAQPPETTTFEFTAAVFNTCNDDLTVINGQETITTRVTRLGQGRVRYDFRDVQSGTGTGLTGEHYTYTNTFRDSFVATPEGQLARSMVTQCIKLKKAGGPASEDLTVVATERIIFDATTGGPLHVKREFRAVC